MIIAKDSLKTYLGLFVVVTIVSFFIAIRELDVGTDTEVYVNYFMDLASGKDVVQLEYGFYCLSFLLSSLGLPYEFNFYIFSALNFFFIGWFVNSIGVESGSKKFLLFFVMCLLINPFFAGFQVNALRQGLSFFLLLYSFSFLLNRKYAKFVVVCFLSSMFHFSSLIYLPFLLILFLGFYKVVVIQVLLFFAYIAGFTEAFVELFSTLTGLPIYEYISNYDSFADYNSGVRVDFALFSIIPTLYFCLIKVTGLLKIDNVAANVYRIYSILLIPFWLLGWGNYSNRYAMPAWVLYFVLLFVPVVNLKKISVGVVFIPVFFSMFIFLLFLHFKVIM